MVAAAGPTTAISVTGIMCTKHKFYFFFFIEKQPRHMNNNLVCVCVVLCNEQHRYIRLCHIVMHTNNICVCRAKRTSHSESFGKIALIFDLAPINSQGSSNKILGDKNTCISKIVEWKDHNTEENKQEKNERSKRAARAALTKLAADQSRERERESKGVKRIQIDRVENE